MFKNFLNTVMFMAFAITFTFGQTISNGGFENGASGFPTIHSQADYLTSWSADIYTDPLEGAHAHSPEWCVAPDLFHLHSNGTGTNDVTARSGSGYAGMARCELLMQELNANFIPGGQYKFTIWIKPLHKTLTLGDYNWIYESKLDILISNSNFSYDTSDCDPLCALSSPEFCYLENASNIITLASFPLSEDLYPLNQWHKLEAVVTVPMGVTDMNHLAIQVDGVDEFWLNNAYVALDDFSLLNCATITDKEISGPDFLCDAGANYSINVNCHDIISRSTTSGIGIDRVTWPCTNGTTFNISPSGSGQKGDMETFTLTYADECGNLHTVSKTFTLYAPQIYDPYYYFCYTGIAFVHIIIPEEIQGATVSNIHSNDNINFWILGGSTIIISGVTPIDSYTLYYDVTTNCGTYTCSFGVIIESPWSSNCDGIIKPLGEGIVQNGIQHIPIADLQVHPNPFNDQLTVEYNLNSNGYVNVTLIDITGKPVSSLLETSWQESGAQRLQPNLAGIAPGIYFLKIEHPSGILTQKLMKL